MLVKDYNFIHIVKLNASSRKLTLPVPDACLSNDSMAVLKNVKTRDTSIKNLNLISFRHHPDML